MTLEPDDALRTPEPLWSSYGSRTIMSDNTGSPSDRHSRFDMFLPTRIGTFEAEEPATIRTLHRSLMFHDFFPARPSARSIRLLVPSASNSPSKGQSFQEI
ncbi:hypothetical protein E1B28_011186 [Marasmius oreades]|uniref:Uncharacterized protein n=1 Tax=Marasmius oreades TaxID=181124 RepID=A0A9P7UPP8_9AGAR|nr:uncharacterized protein E1B28_011186 [Marasmius oreades]KAG7089508.1 hypothetical protein E1B28_011186 [Marasmius oreades]